ncbi:MAG: ribonuclease HII [Patescibacteria group bacterium]
MVKISHIIGIDEAGRGPLAGPVGVGAVIMSRLHLDKFGCGVIFKKLPNLKDSKKLSEKQREVWFEFLKAEKKKGNLDFAVALVSEKIIDKQGIVKAIKIGISRCLKLLLLPTLSRDPDRSVGAIPSNYLVLLDGSLKAPENFVKQKTIIRGDESEPIISLASIVAKVTRDRRMIQLAKKYPNYGFEIHKGYGTKVHYRAIKKFGLSVIHRQTYCDTNNL